MPAGLLPAGADPADEAARGRQRRCIVTGALAPRGSLLRFVVGPDGEIVPDIEARLPGRGLWLTPRRDIVEQASKKRLFARAARRSVSVSPELAGRIEALLARRCIDKLGLARRAGIAVAGFDRVEETLRRGRAALLLFALDGAEGGRRKLGTAWREVESAMALHGDELGAAFGRDRVAFAALGAGPLCGGLLLELRRLSGFREDAAFDRDVISAPARPGQQDGGIEAHE